MSETEKDWWDKFEIIGKIIVGLAVPVVVASTAYLLNSQISERARASEMTKIAVGILSTQPPSDQIYKQKELRRWAISVLRDPSDEHKLTDEAAEILLEQSIGCDGSRDCGWSDSGSADDGDAY